MDRKRVLSNGPWNLFKNLLLFSEVDEALKIYDLNFKMLDLWVQVHNLPLSCMSQTCAEMIGKQIGCVIEIAFGLKGECWGKFLL